MQMMTLNKLNLNTVAQIDNLNCTGSIRRRLLDLGLVKNTKIKPVLKSPSGDPTAFEVRGSIIALREEDSQNIQVLTNISKHNNMT